MAEFNRPDLRERVRIGLRIAQQFGLDVDETIRLTVPVADLVTPNLFTGHPKGAWGRASIGAPGVGDNGMSFVQAVPQRGIITHVTGVWISGTITTNALLRVGNSDISAIAQFALLTAKQFTDARDVGVPDTDIGVMAPLTAAVPGSPVALYTLSGNVLQFIPLNTVLGELGWIAVQNQTTDEAMDCSWEWTEYLLEDR